MTSRRVLSLGHTNLVGSVSLSSDGTRALSGSLDRTVRVWDLSSGECLQVLEGHSGDVNSVSLSSDGTRALSGGGDRTVRVWDVSSGECLQVLEGHSEWVNSVSLSSDGTRALSGSDDRTVRVWDLSSGECLQVLEGHSGDVISVSLSSDGTRALSGSGDQTVRVWDVSSGECLQVLEGHSGPVRMVGFLAGNSPWSAASNGVLRFWGHRPEGRQSTTEAFAHYTNAKVLFVGETGAGKTGLSSTIASGEYAPSEGSTVGAWATQMRLGVDSDQDLEREVWLWDFGGQADQRLVHQLYIDGSAAVVVVFNADQRDPIPGLRDWKRALDQSIKTNPAYFLVAGRTDAGLQFERSSLQKFADENGYQFFETSARTGHNLAEFKKALLGSIDWDKIAHRSSPVAYKKLNDAIIGLRDEDVVLLTLGELKERLRGRVDSDVDVDKNVAAVVGLLDSPGVVKELDFGRYVLLRPEWINKYAQAVIRTIKADDQNLGCIDADRIRKADLLFRNPNASENASPERLGPEDEPIVLRAMEDALLERGLCLREDERLVFPSYCGVERPPYPSEPLVNVSYLFDGYLDDLYATLVTRLAQSGAFRLEALWRDAADFTDRTGEYKLGVRLQRTPNGSGIIELYREKSFKPTQEVLFAEFVHRHLERKGKEVERQRHYICSECGTAVLHFEIAMGRLKKDGRLATISCVECDHKVPLWDDLEDMFADPKLREEVLRLEEHIRVELDARRKASLLVYETLARIAEADQKGEEVPGNNDEGIDIRLEFTMQEVNDKGNSVAAGTGRFLMIQAKCGNSYLRERKRDAVEVFDMEHKWAIYWAKQTCPVMLVIGTFPDGRFGREKVRFAEVRWMEVGEYCREEIKAGRKVTKIEFRGEPLTTANILKWREKVLSR